MTTSPPIAPITLRELLRLPSLQRGAPEVLSGHEALDQPVRWVHAGEVPNIASLLKGRELLLTTGMGIETDERGCRRFVDDLARTDVAGVAIELGSTLDSVPEAMLRQARRRGLPIIALHRELPFVAVTEAAHQVIVNHHYGLLHNGDEVQRRFTELALNGAGIPELLSALAETVGNPVVLEKAGAGVAYHAVHHTEEATVLGTWETYHRGAATGVDVVARPVAMGGGESWGTLLALGLHSPLDDLDRVAVERAAGIVALALKQDREEAFLAIRERGNFLDSLLSRTIDDAEAGVRARALGLPRRLWPVLTFGIAPLPSRSPVYAEEMTWALVWRDVQRWFSQRRQPAIIGGRGNGGLTLALVVLSENADREKEATAAAEFIGRTAARRFGTEEPAVVAVGRLARDWQEARASLREAEDTALAATHGPHRLWHDAMRPDVDRLLWSLRDHSAMKSFAYARLKPIIDHDRNHKTQLMPTLRAYCEHAGRKSDAARALYVERQTLYYRLARIETLLGADLADGEVVLGLHLALRAQAHLSGEGR